MTISLKSVNFVTGNKLKFEVAQSIFNKFGIELMQVKADIPEIQAETTKEVALFSAKYAANLLQIPVIVNDSGFYIEALNGFPGIYTKDINAKFTTLNLLDLMARYDNRKVSIRHTTAYCEPNQDPIAFESTINSIMLRESKTNHPNCFDNILMIDGFDVVRGEISFDELKSKVFPKLDDYANMAQYLRDNI
jgi:XTP/dITP diphosphohydrolase